MNIPAFWNKRVLPLTLLVALPCLGSIASDSNQSLQHVLVNPLEPGADIHKGAWNMSDPYIEVAEDVEPQMGTAALTFGGSVKSNKGKGDFSVSGLVPGVTKQLALFVHLTDDANVSTLGLQIRDHEGEILQLHVPADWTGWKAVEFDLEDFPVTQTYPQAGKNSSIDFPIRDIHFSWFSEHDGATHLTVDGLTAVTELDEKFDGQVQVDIQAPDEVEAGDVLSAFAYFTNYSDFDVELTVDYSLQRNPAFFNDPLGDPVYGSNHAPEGQTWVEVNGERIDDDKSMDGKMWTTSSLPGKPKHYSSADVIVDLETPRTIRQMKWRSGDANKTWFVDVMASMDGETYYEVAELQGVDQHAKWGINQFPEFEPFDARWVKFHYRTKGEKVNTIHFPSEIMIMDGVEDEQVGIPDVGEVVDSGSAVVTIPARSFASEFLDFFTPFEGGAYLLGVDVKGNGIHQVEYRNVFTALAEKPGLLHNPDARVVINTSRPELVPKIAELGSGWVRFENMKWPFVSSEPHKYQYNPGVKPWAIRYDDLYQDYKDHGIEILPYMFLVPKWSSQPGPDVPERMLLTQRPKDLADYGEFCFQTVARYGSKKHPPEVLKTEDKVSGLNLINYYEMYNEPNMNPSPKATWGAWAAPMSDFYEMMRFGAEGVKAADPDAIITSTAYAGATVDVVDPMRTYTYADGKHPIDFVDIINVHYYSGHEAPETSTTDGNVRKSTGQTFSKNMRELSEWRDLYAPGKPIWMTETGYDTAGPFGTNETIQAARLPRQVMLCLANGVEKVFVYREAGSTPSKHAASGLLRNDYSKKPSWYTYGTLIREFVDVKGGALRLPYEDENVWLLLWDNGGAPMVTAWTVNGRAKLDIDLGPCEMTDAFGSKTDLESTDGLELGVYPIYMNGFKDMSEIDSLKGEYFAQEAAYQKYLGDVAALKKYLFDFGHDDQVGTLRMESIKTPYVAIQNDSLWSDDAGYGFNTEAKSTDDRKYLRDKKLDRDSVKVNGEVFSFEVEPGRYVISLKADSYVDTLDTLVSYGNNSPIKLEVSKSNPVAETEIAVLDSNTKVNVEIVGAPGNLYWIKCVEVM